MNLKTFLGNLGKTETKIVHFCAIHMLEKVYDIKVDNIDENDLKEFFINYSNYDKYLNDYANVIYNQYESSKDEVYALLCKYFNEESDNKFLFEYRLKRIVNQNPTIYLKIEDEEMRNAAILRVQEKIDIIKTSKYYKENSKLAEEQISELERKLDLTKKAVGLD